MVCKDCIYDDMCAYHELGVCEYFKDKSRFMEFPCKLGDRVYCIDRKTEIIEPFVLEFRTIRTGTYAMFGENEGVNIEMFGKTVFLERKDAEKALREEFNDIR